MGRCLVQDFANWALESLSQFEERFRRPDTVSAELYVSRSILLKTKMTVSVFVLDIYGRFSKMCPLQSRL